VHLGGAGALARPESIGDTSDQNSYKRGNTMFASISIRRARIVPSAFAVACVLGSATDAGAHHGDAGRFEEFTVTMTGTVVALQLINPHSSLILDVTDEGGDTERWQAEFTSPGNLMREFGWDRNTLKPGDQITITGRPIKSGQPFINLSERARILRTATCEEIYRTSSDPDEPPTGPACN
jgi:hypothetical protein